MDDLCGVQQMLDSTAHLGQALAHSSTYAFGLFVLKGFWEGAGGGSK